MNGDFEQTVDVGWDTMAVNTAGGDTFTWSDTLGQPTPGHAVSVRKYLAKYASLNQTVDIPNVNLTLSFDGCLEIGGGSSTCWPVAAFAVRYLDSAGMSMGNTMLYLHDQYCTWAVSDTQSLIEVTTPGVWTPFSIDIASEISTHLPGIDPANVRKLTIDLFAYDNGT
ncbi:hypothetical protein FJY68_10650 [candidate division WOR-3 bacterium]|uniref:Uncharacterized protein n=1 Tax=candidate division WOR-3 bacterium TaxID=2052148 RepID=A0A937XEK8_UNCW3|nr:hypothetical protein [candidate division WOR-3 bacterium]